MTINFSVIDIDDYIKSRLKFYLKILKIPFGNYLSYINAILMLTIIQKKKKKKVKYIKILRSATISYQKFVQIIKSILQI